MKMSRTSVKCEMIKSFRQIRVPTRPLGEDLGRPAHFTL
jgi:hypothetical protein